LDTLSDNLITVPEVGSQ